MSDKSFFFDKCYFCFYQTPCTCSTSLYMATITFTQLCILSPSIGVIMSSLHGHISLSRHTTLPVPLILTAEQEPPRFLNITFLISFCWVTLAPASTHSWHWSCHHTLHSNLVIWNLAFASVFLTGSKCFISKTGLFSSRNFSSLCPHLPKGSDTTQKYGQLPETQNAWPPEDDPPTPSDKPSLFNSDGEFCPWSFVEVLIT